MALFKGAADSTMRAPLRPRGAISGRPESPNATHLCFSGWAYATQPQATRANGKGRPSLCAGGRYTVRVLYGEKQARTYPSRAFAAAPRAARRCTLQLRYLPQSISGRQHKAIAPIKIAKPMLLQPWRPSGKTPAPYNAVMAAISRKKGPVR